MIPARLEPSPLPLAFVIVALGCRGVSDPNVGDLPAAVTCGAAEVFTPVKGKPSLPADLGRILACQFIGTRTAAQVSASKQYQMHGWSAETGYHEYVVQYVSQGPKGKPNRVSAIVYLPVGGKGPYPIVAVNHGTAGMGPSCGPTHRREYTDYMALPLAGRGYAVVASDYPGLGVDEGSVHPYGVGESEALAILDGVRAIRGFKDPGRWEGGGLADELFLAGHSQGGQATLFAHQYYDASVGVRLLGSITWAPGLGDLRGFNQIVGDSARAIDITTVFVTMVLYGSATYHGAPENSAWLTPGAQLTLPSMLRDQCFDKLYLALPATFPSQGYLFSPGFLAGAKSCAFDGQACPQFEPWKGYLDANLPGNFRADAPALLVQGEKDDIVPAYTTACVAKRMKSRGSPSVTLCGYAAANHYDIVDYSYDEVLAWMKARREGRTVEACKAPVQAACPN